VTNVDWTNQALEDLQELPPDVAQAILEVGRTSLHTAGQMLAADLDEGYGRSDKGTPLYWRRAITSDERQRLNELEEVLAAKESQQTDDEDNEIQSWHYVLLYRERSLTEAVRRKGRGFVVLSVLHASRIAFLLQREMAREMARTVGHA
jgi:hypothetical protein